MTENELTIKVLKDLQKFFYVKKSVTGRNLYDHKRVRIDAVIVPRNPEKWANPDIIFGVEFKKPESIICNKDRIKLARQCIDYHYSEFEVKPNLFKRFPILFYPYLSTEDHYLRNEVNVSFLLRLVNVFNIGELREINGIYSIVFAQDHVIWIDGEVTLQGQKRKFLIKKGGER